MRPGFLHNFGQPVRFGFQNAPSEARQTVVSSARIVSGRTVPRLFHKPLVEQLLQIVVKGPRPQFVSATCLARNLGHDGVSVPILSCESQQDMKNSR